MVIKYQTELQCFPGEKYKHPLCNTITEGRTETSQL